MDKLLTRKYKNIAVIEQYILDICVENAIFNFGCTHLHLVAVRVDSQTLLIYV